MPMLKIKEFAEKRRINQTELHEMTGLSLQLINRYWNNKMDRITFDAIIKIAKALGVKPGSLISWEDGGEEKQSA